MGTFTIYSIGDSAFLEQILIAVSMVTGTGDFRQMVSIGLLLGVLMVTVQSVLRGAKELNLQQILIGWVLYACFFGPSTTVLIEDAYTGQVRPVAGVPLGVGAAGGIISSVGYKITRLFETGYGVIVPGVTNSHFADSLKLLNDVRRRGYDSAVFGALNAANGGGNVDVRRSWNNYIRECTLTKIDLGLMPLDDLMRSPTDTALRFSSALYGTRLYLSPGAADGTDYTCTDGWIVLSDATQSLNHPVVVDALSNLLGVNTATGNNALTQIGNSLQAVGAVSTSSLDYLKAAVLEPLYYEAASGRYQDLQDYGSALMVNQAIQQRNTQWAAEQTVFMSVVRPMLTFFEGFVYAITPMMAFLIVIGSFGIGLAGKYIQTLLWIQLWMPVLSIINLFVHTAASSEMASLSADGLSSMYALSSAGVILQSWIATGGMMAVFTPVISLFIVSGSTYALTNIASRIGGADHVNEKMQSPDALQPGPMVKSLPAYNQDQFSGLLASGAQGMLGTLNMASSLGSSVSSAQATQNQKSETFQNTLSRGFSDNVTQEQAHARLSNIGRNLSSQNTQESAAIEQRAKEFVKSHQMDEKHTDAVKGAIALQATGAADGAAALMAALPAKGLLGVLKKGGEIIGAGRGKGGAGVKAEGQIRASSSSEAADSTTLAAADLTKAAEGINFSQGEKQALTAQMAQGVTESGGESNRRTWGDALGNTLTQSASELVSATETYSSLSDIQSRMGSATNTDFKTLGGEVAQSPEAMRRLNEAMSMAPAGARAEADALEKRYRSDRYGMSAPVAQAAARMTALTNAQHYAPGKEVGGFQAVADVINTASGRSGTPTGDPYRNAHLRSPDTEGTESRVRAAVGNGPQFAEGFRDDVANRAATDPTAGGMTGTDVMAHHDGGSAAVRAHAQGSDRRVSAPHVEAARQQIVNSYPEMSTAASQWGAVDNGARFAGRALSALGEGFGVGWNDFKKGAEQIHNMTPEEAREFKTQMYRGDEAIREQYGPAGTVMVGGMQLGRNVGAALVDGARAAFGGQPLSEVARGMTLEERGAFYAGAAAAASSVGGEAAEQFWAQNRDAFKEVLHETKESQGLTPAQAAVFAEGYSTDIGLLEQAKHDLKLDYAERRPDGTPLTEGGKPVLTPENEALANSMIDGLLGASSAGDRAGSYLTPIQNYNLATRDLIGGSR